MALRTEAKASRHEALTFCKGQVNKITTPVKNALIALYFDIAVKTNVKSEENYKSQKVTQYNMQLISRNWLIVNLFWGTR